MDSSKDDATPNPQSSNTSLPYSDDMNSQNISVKSSSDIQEYSFPITVMPSESEEFAISTSDVDKSLLADSDIPGRSITISGIPRKVLSTSHNDSTGDATIILKSDEITIEPSVPQNTQEILVTTSGHPSNTQEYAIATTTCLTSPQEISVIQFENYEEPSVHTETVVVSVSEDVSQSETATTTKNKYVCVENIAAGMLADTQTENDPNTVMGMACMICADKGSGYHYSVYSCEGCKGFFKRSVQKNLTYNCRDVGSCVINKFTRNSCQHCRFQRCMEMGMRKDAVREDRSPGGKHRHKRLRTDEFCIAVGSEDDYQLVQSEGVEASDEVRDNLIENLIAADPDAIPKADDLGVDEVMQYGYAELKYIIDWAKKVPGFHELCLEDQMALLKAAFMELSIFRLSYRSLNLNNCIKFAEGLTIPVDIAQNMGWGKELINATVDFCKRLKDIDLDHTEFCILNGIILTYPDASGIVEKLQVTKLQTRILDALRRYVSQQYTDQPDRFGRMLLRLPSLRTISAKAAERFLSLTLDGSVQLNDLMLEMIN